MKTLLTILLLTSVAEAHLINGVPAENYSRSWLAGHATAQHGWTPGPWESKWDIIRRLEWDHRMGMSHRVAVSTSPYRWSQPVIRNTPRYYLCPHCGRYHVYP